MSNLNKKLSRRKYLPLLAGSLILPLLGMGKGPTASKNSDESNQEEDYQTLLKPDGTAVKVPRKTVEQARVVKKNISNKSLLGWLKNPTK